MSTEQILPIGLWKPCEARKQFRTNPDLEGKSSSGYCAGYLQANLAVLPASLADDFEQFCEINKAPCPLLYRSGVGEVTAGRFASDSDVRTDLQFYCVSENGIIVKKTGNLNGYSMEGFVSFYLGCSFSFEQGLINSGIEVQNISRNCNVSMFTTNIHCVPVGPFSCPMVVSMRPIQKDQIEKAVVVTSAYDSVHGAPIHIGDPTVIGIHNVNRPEFGCPSDIGDLIPVFWACGVTSSLAVRSAKSPLSFSHYPGSMFICDVTVDEYFTTHKPEHGKEEPRLVTLADHPNYLASVCSASAMTKIHGLAEILWKSPSEVVASNGHLPVGDAFLKIAVRLSHASSIVICFLHENEILSTQRDSTSDGILALLALVKAFQALHKKVRILTQHGTHLLQEKITACLAEEQITTDLFRVVKWDDSCDLKERLFDGKINHRLDAMVALQSVAKTEINKSEENDALERFFREVKTWEVGIVRVKITAGEEEISLDETNEGDSYVLRPSSLKLAGDSIAAALYLLHQCPIHSRYVRRGIGKREQLEIEKFLIEEDHVTCSQIFDSVTRPEVTGV